MKKIGIIGLGLIGGSIAKAIKHRIIDIEIVAFNRSEQPLIDAYNEKIIDKYSTTDLTIFENCEIVFICTPVDKIPIFIDKIRNIITKDCIITDVGSTKNVIFNKMKEYKDITFIAGHPMAGSEKNRYCASSEYLFENALYMLCPTEDTPQEKINIMFDVIKILGAKAIVVEPEYHDFIVASVSHTEHIIAASLVNAVLPFEKEDKYMHLVAAGGFRDTTRIAAASPEMWASICLDNKTSIIKVLDSFKQQLSTFEEYLNNNDYDKMYSYFDKAKEYRETFTFDKK